MQKVQAQNIVRETLQNDFNKERFLYFIKNLLNKVDDSKAFHARGYVLEAYKKFIKTYERLATYTDPDGIKVDILVVYLQKETSLERARTAQRNFVARYLKDRNQKDAGLIAFVSPDLADWRFSLVKMDYKFTEDKSGKIKVKEEFTPGKRWSFLVGKNENSHTAQSRLAPIVEDDQANPTFKQLEDAFNIEKVTKEFFEKYRELFLRVHETLSDVIQQQPDIKADFTEKNVNTVDFSKKLLGQIVFLYFLQKKGWFGVPMNKGWGEGDKKFLRTLFEGATGKSKNYFNDYLEPLFYEALAKERDDDFYSRFECKIPFLNGGLFDPISNYDWVNTIINLPNELFSNEIKDLKTGDIGNGVLDIFDRYNFTVKEDEPLEKEVAIDPEMLGKVFENLLEVKDRKSKGTYYTPREIVHYMCEQSLINYLAIELEGNVSKEDLEKLIKIGENIIEHEVISVSKEDNPEYSGDYKRLLPDSIKKFSKEIDDKLATIKVCDPAIGSGAFPVGMMNAIIKARLVLSSYIKDENRTAYNFKRDCIQNSLYGVDIDPGAVEIAKLRLWLSLVVDEDDIKQIKPLPNLDYKIMQGNSLLEEFEGIKLFDERLITDINFNKGKQIEILEERQNELQREYFKLHSKNQLTSTKQAELNGELKRIGILIKKLNKPNEKPLGNAGLFDAHSEARQKADSLKRSHKEFFEATQKSKKDNLKKQIEKLEWELIEATLKEQNKTSALKKLEEFKRSNTKPFFLWKLNFADVFQENGGFSVVIGNPPYLEARSSEFSDQMKEKVQRGLNSRWLNDASYITRGADLLIYFFELGIYLMSQKGTQVFLTQNSWLDTDYGKRFQSFLLKNTDVKFIIDSDFKYFDGRLGPNINTIISVFSSKGSDEKGLMVFARYHENYEKVNCFDLASTESSSQVDIKKFKHSDALLRNFKWGTLLSASNETLHIISIMEKKGKRLSQLSDYSLSIGQGLNLRKSFEVEEKILTSFPFLFGNLLPFMTSGDGAPFVLSKTKKFIIDGANLNLEQIKKLKKSNIEVLQASSKIKPSLILPRGVTRHYCAVNKISAFSSSGVDIYKNAGDSSEEALLNLWLFLNSSLAWLIREITGRKSLGGGLLKAEATDLKDLPLFFNFKKLKDIKKIYKLLSKRQSLKTLEEINTEEHIKIDQIVFDTLGLTEKERKNVYYELNRLVSNRANKAMG